MRLLAALLCVLCLLPGLAVGEEGFAPLQIALRGNLSAGYEWKCEYQDNGVLVAPMEDFIADPFGGDGVFEYNFGVNKAGQARINFNYAPTVGISAPSQSIICTVVVMETGENHLLWTQYYEDDHTIMVVLPTNPTTGKTWNYAGDVSGVVSFLGEDYQSHYVDLEGAGGTTQYVFRALKPGKTLLAFDYCDVWDPHAPAEATYGVKLTVGENMEISLDVEDSWGGGSYDTALAFNDGAL